MLDRPWTKPKITREEGLLTETQHEVVKRSPLSETFQKMGAVIRVDRGWEGVAHFTSPQEEAEAVRRAVGLADCSSIPKFDLQGSDLNSSPELGAEAQAWRLREGRYLVTCRPENRDLIQGELNRFVAAAGASSGPVYLTDLTSGYAALLLAGPRSPEVLRKLVDLDVSGDAFPNLTCAQTGVHHTYAILVRQDIQSLLAYLILVNREYGEWLWETVFDAGAEFGIRPFGSAAHELLTNK